VLEYSSGDTFRERQLWEPGVDQLLAIDGAPRVSRQFLYGPAVDQLLAAEDIDYDGNGNVDDTDILWTLLDHQNTVRRLYGIADGQTEESVLSTFTYDDFGRPGVAHELVRHAGRPYDSETDLFYNRARYYDPNAGRFISQDPLGFGGGDTNLDRYAGNSPSNATDPGGCRASFWGDPVDWAYGTDGAIWDWGRRRVRSGGSINASATRSTNVILANANGWTLLGNTAVFAITTMDRVPPASRRAP